MRSVYKAAVCLMLLGLAAFAQTDPGDEAGASRAARIVELMKRLRWHDEASSQAYDRTKDELTQRALEEVDGFVGEAFLPRITTAAQARLGVDALLGYKAGDVTQNAALSAALPNGDFLILGVELRRGGDAISDDAISFRAYKKAERRFVFVASTDILRRSDLHVKAIPIAPVAGEFWLMGLAMMPQQSPFMTTMRLYAFDGETFRTVWAPRDIIAEGAQQAVEVTANGFAVSKLFDPTGGAAHSPSVVIHEQYILNPDGPLKVREWETERQ